MSRLGPAALGEHLTRKDGLQMRIIVISSLVLIVSACYAGTITETGGNNELAPFKNNHQSCDCFTCSSWWSEVRIPSGSNGVYTHDVDCTTSKVVVMLHYGADCIPSASVPSGTSAGWREKRVTAADSCDYIEWTVQLRVKLRGSFDCDNDYMFYSGDCNAYGWGMVELAGKAAGDAEVKGSLSASEGDTNIGVGAGPVNLSAPFSLTDSAGPFAGDKIVNSVSGQSEAADVNDRIYMTGSVSSSASTGDGAAKSEVKVEIINDNFNLTFTS